MDEPRSQPTLRNQTFQILYINNIECRLHSLMMSSKGKTLKEELESKIAERRCDEVQLLNLPIVSNSPRDAYETIEAMLVAHKESYIKNRQDLSTTLTLDKTAQLSPVVDALNKRLQDHLRMLRQTETTTKQPNAVLEFDMAKERADKLAEILQAKLVWDNSYEELQLLDASDVTMRYQKLVLLQQSFEVLSQYSLDAAKVEAFERMKDEFLSWYSPATILAIDSNDLKQLESIRDKYSSLDRIKVFEANFGNYARNKIKCFVEADETAGSQPKTLWSILEEFFGIWKRCHRIVDSFVEENASELVAQNLHEGLTAKWDKVLGIVEQMVADAENPFDGAKSIGKILSDFMDLAEREGGDEHILEALDKLNRAIFAVLSDDYGKHARSILLQTINKITAPEKSSRHRHNWLMPYLEEVQSCMRTMVNEAKATFGAGFPQQIVPSFEHGVRELNSLLQNQDILSIRADGGKDIRMRKSVQENTEDKISAISVTGYLINMIEDMNEYIREMAAEFLNLADAPPQISNSHLLETLNLRTVGRKIESIANTIICPMEEEMKKLLDKHLEELGTDPAGGAKDELSLSLPQFAVSPHNYVTSIGHGLLSQMNTIGAYGADRNFIRAIQGAADDTKSPFNEDEADLWLLTEVAKLVQNAFCSNIGKVGQLPQMLRRQFNADTVFLMDALADLRLQPTAQLTKLAQKLKESVA